MAKKAYVGVDGVARKIKKGYIGVGGLARKIKKGYIGVGGVARPFWGGGEVVYWGNKSQYSTKDRRIISMASVGDYAILYGGAVTDSTYSNRLGYAYVEAYNSSLTRTTANTISNDKRYGSGGGTIGNYALFVGGDDASTSGTSKTKYVSRYNASLTRGTVSTLTDGFILPNCANIGEDFIVFGGYRYSEIWDDVIYNMRTFVAYNPSLTGSQITSVYDTDVMVSVGDYVLCVGGYYVDTESESGNTPVSIGKSYVIDKSLTVINIPYHVTAGGGVSATTLNGNAIVVGGAEPSNQRTKVTDEVHIWNPSLTHTMGTPLSQARRWAKGITLCGFAIFAGGTTADLGGSQTSKFSNTAGSDVVKTVDTYDESFTRVIAQDMSVPAYLHSAATTGNYALFSGGSGTKGQIEIYTVI